jgi:AcrR family transcriptional regulator
MKNSTTPFTGLRERKRGETLARITDEALKLFVQRGFEATTLDDIAAAAGISRRTFFHYFESKEDLAFAWLDGTVADIVAAVKRERADQPLLTIAANAIIACAAPFSRDEARGGLRARQAGAGDAGAARPVADEIRQAGDRAGRGADRAQGP